MGYRKKGSEPGFQDLVNQDLEGIEIGEVGERSEKQDPVPVGRRTRPIDLDVDPVGNHPQVVVG